MKELVRQKYSRAIYRSTAGPRRRSRAPGFNPTIRRGEYAGLVYNVAYTKAMLQAALSG